METKPRFNLNESLEHWRKELAGSSSLRKEELDELESHLRDDVVVLRTQGLSDQEAWVAATTKLGCTKALALEYAKANDRRSKRRALTAIVASISALFGIGFAVGAYWLFRLTAGTYGIGRPDGTIVFVISSTRGWLLFFASLLASLLLLAATWALFKSLRRQGIGASFLLAAVLVAFTGCTKGAADSATCLQNLSQIGLAAATLSLTNRGRFPADFRSLQTGLYGPRNLVCPAYNRRPPPNWEGFDWKDVTYEMVWPALDGASTSDVSKIYVRCPKHGYFVLGDGSAHKRDCHNAYQTTNK